MPNNHERYDDDKVAELIQQRLPGWRVEGTYLARTYDTGNWNRTMMLANAIAYLGEKAWHHPDLFLGYPSVKVLLTTHDAAGITARDVALAEEIERLAQWVPDREIFKDVEHWFD